MRKESVGSLQQDLDTSSKIKIDSMRRKMPDFMGMVRGSLGFTLIELLVVIAVIGVIAGVVLVAINPMTQMAKARDAQRKTDIRAIANALEQYYVFYLKYPPELQGCDSSRGTNGNTNCIPPPSGSNWASASDLSILINGGYLKKLPIDPINAQKNSVEYLYIYEPYGYTYYWIGTRLEKPSDDLPIFRCADGGPDLTYETGCRSVDDWRH